MSFTSLESLSEHILSPNAADFVEAAAFSAPTARLLPNAWCPQLDVFVLFSRIADKNHLILHSMRDAPVWDVELEGDAPHPDISAVCWSPNGD
jgi:hypothetical protein